MIKLIIGKKGSGKTKKLIELVNNAADTSKGNVVCIEKGDTLTYSITHKARLVDAEAYDFHGYPEYYAFLCGICAGNHDVTDIFGDATLRIGTRDYEELTAFLERVSVLSKASETDFTFTVSCAEEDIPAKAFEFAEKI